MHASVQEFVEKTLTSSHVTGKTVIEVGSYDVNGSVRPYVESLEPACYVGVDARSGPGVDVVYDVERLDELQLCWVNDDGTRDVAWDLVISIEMLEHTRDWRAAVAQLGAAVGARGWLLLATRTPEPDACLVHDHWNFTETDLVRVMDELGFSSPLFVDRYSGDGVDGVIVLGCKSVLQEQHLGGIQVQIAPAKSTAVAGCRWVLSATAEKVT